MTLRRRVLAAAKSATQGRDHPQRRYMLAIASVPVPILHAAMDTYRAELIDGTLDIELARRWPAIADLDRRLAELRWPPDDLRDDDPAWYLIEIPQPNGTLLAEADRVLELCTPDPADWREAALHVAATYLAHLASALTMTEAQLDRLPAVDAGLAYLAHRGTPEAGA